MRLDHVVLWVEDPLRSIAFFVDVVGLRPVRVDEFREGKAPFPSVRISDDTIVDLMPRIAAPMLDGIAGAIAPSAARSAGHTVNHVCIAMSELEFEALRLRLEQNGVAVGGFMQRSFGAKGPAERTFYFSDPDGNVLEARYYGEAST